MEADTDSSNPGPIVDVAWLKTHRDSTAVRIIDVRPLGHYMMGHIPGAVQIDINAIRLPNSNDDGIAGFIASARAYLQEIGIQPDDQVVFYEDYSGSSAARGVWMLDAVGHGGGMMLDGGIRAWSYAKEPLSRDTPIPESSSLDVSLNPAVFATAKDITSALESHDAVTILDARNDAEFISGTIPNAFHLEWIHHLSPDGTFLPLNDLRTMYEAIGVTATGSQPVITFCGSGYRSAHTYVVLKALGIPKVRNYGPSWGEWGRRSDLPVEVPRYR